MKKIILLFCCTLLAIVTVSAKDLTLMVMSDMHVLDTTLFAESKSLLDFPRSEISEVFKSILYNYTDSPSNTCDDQTIRILL